MSIDRKTIRQALQDAGVWMTARTQEGRQDYTPEIYQLVEAVITQGETRTMAETMELFCANNGHTYQYTVIEHPDTSPDNPFTHILYALDYPHERRKLILTLENFHKLDELAEELVYAAHARLMERQQYLEPPGEFRGLHMGSPVYGITLSNMYSLKMITYNESLPREHVPPRWRDDIEVEDEHLFYH